MRKNAPEDDMERDRRRPMLRILAQQHILDPERGRVCGCPECLLKAGLERVEVLDPNTGKFHSMLVDWFSTGNLDRAKNRAGNSKLEPRLFQSDRSV